MCDNCKCKKQLGDKGRTVTSVSYEISKLPNKNVNVCCKAIKFDIVEHISTGKFTISNLNVQGGCSGYGKAVCALVEGVDVDDLDRLLNIDCGDKGTSCSKVMSHLAMSVKDVLVKSREYDSFEQAIMAGFSQSMKGEETANVLTKLKSINQGYFEPDNETK